MLDGLFDQEPAKSVVMEKNDLDDAEAGVQRLPTELIGVVQRLLPGIRKLACQSCGISLREDERRIAQGGSPQ